MSATTIQLDPAISTAYPEAKIGLLKVHFPAEPQAIDLPSAPALQANLESRGMHASTYVEHPNIKPWRQLFQQDMGINPKAFRPSIDALARRVIRGKGLPKILPLVDAYNRCSVQTLLPMGGYDVSKLNGPLTLRYGKEGETFLPLHECTPQQVAPQHIVYADDARVVCWLWNHKDTTETCITEDTRTALFCIDSLTDATSQDLNLALATLKEDLEKIGGSIEGEAILSSQNPAVSM